MSQIGQGTAQNNESPLMTIPIAQVRNTDTQHNLNRALAQEVPITGTVDFLDQAHFTVEGSGVVCLFQGRVKVTTSVHMVIDVEGLASSRPNVQLRIRRNNTDLGVIGASGYIRNAGGHQESSVHVTEVCSVEEGDVITVTTKREADEASIVRMVSGTSVLLLERVS